MFVLGLQGSPRKKGNTDILLSRLMETLRARGIQTHTVAVASRNILPCKELTVCEQKGYCPIDDDMGREIYALLRKADVVVAATPVFFYGFSAQLKALIDRCQTLWARRYMLKLKDPGQPQRRGYLLAVGATGGKQLFDGIHLTARYFFDGISADYVGSLTYRHIEGRGRIADVPDLAADIERAAAEMLGELAGRRKVLFVCKDNAVLGPMAAAFVRLFAGDRFDPVCAGLQPAAGMNPLMIASMAEKGIDMAFLKTTALAAAIAEQMPDEIIALGCSCPGDLGCPCTVWDMSLPGDRTSEALGQLRDAIEQRVIAYTAEQTG